MLAGLALIAMFSACSKQDDTENDFETKPINGGKAVEITRYVGSKSKVIIPPRIRRLPVTSIGFEAFTDKYLTGVTIPNSVKSIGRRAFFTNQLTGVTIPVGVTSIEAAAFASNQLTDITIPDSVTSIGEAAFSGNQLTSVTIPASVISIEGHTFRDNQLTGVTIPDSVTSIGEYAFYHNQLATVTIPASVTSIGKCAFNRNRLTVVTIPASVTSMGECAFEGNELTSITIQVGVTSIAGGAFSYNRLTSVTIPDSVTSIGQGAFANNQLTDITIPASVISIEGHTFRDNRLTDVTIPDTITSIEVRAFANNQLTSITIPDSVISIGNEAFDGNYLTSITIGVNVTLGANITPATKYASFDNRFEDAYADYGKGAGTYTRSDRVTWTKMDRIETGEPFRDNMVRIQGGTFMMGSPADEPGRMDNETQHRVTLSSFYIGKYEVTQKEWYEIMGTTVQQQRDKVNPEWSMRGEGDNYPMYYISWLEAVEYCNRRSQKEGLTLAYTVNGTNVTWNRNADGYRLPTEAEWEYACRAGTITAYHTGSSIRNDTGWYLDNSSYKTNPVGLKTPNSQGLYDMHGNVWEWCWDWYGGDYQSGAQTNPAGASSGSNRVTRGGSWHDEAQFQRSAFRGGSPPDDTHNQKGFRLACSSK
jgi:formylglycine-generating enzyme required for sulfatase activity